MFRLIKSGNLIGNGHVRTIIALKFGTIELKYGA